MDEDATDEAEDNPFATPRHAFQWPLPTMVTDLTTGGILEGAVSENPEEKLLVAALHRCGQTHRGRHLAFGDGRAVGSRIAASPCMPVGMGTTEVARDSAEAAAPKRPAPFIPMRDSPATRLCRMAWIR